MAFNDPACSKRVRSGSRIGRGQRNSSPPPVPHLSLPIPSIPGMSTGPGMLEQASGAGATSSQASPLVLPTPLIFSPALTWDRTLTLLGWLV